MVKSNNLLRIGVFYDGHYFYNVSNYYGFEHDRKARISISGLHKFIRKTISDITGADMKLCQIVDAHYFRGRYPVQPDTEQRRLYNERVFEDILINANVVSHYLPLKTDMHTGKLIEKGIDVWLALEAYEMAMYKRFDIIVLVTCDGDYVPLVRKLSTLGTQVMLICWDFEYVDEDGKTRTTRTSQHLMDEVTYPISMHEVIDSRSNRDNSYVRDLFVQSSNAYRRVMPKKVDDAMPESATDNESTILRIIDKGEYKIGFIKGKTPDADIYFSEKALGDYDIDDLEVGDRVRYELIETDDGRLQAKNIFIIE